MTKGKVVLISFPFDDLASSKVRPAVCLTEPIGAHRHVVLAFISSRLPDMLLPADLVLDATAPDFARTGLRVTSVLRLHRLLTVSVSMFRRELGIISTEKQAAVQRKLHELFA